MRLRLLLTAAAIVCATSFARAADLPSTSQPIEKVIDQFVDAANTLAVFVWGPDGIKLEYVEHKPSFSLV